MARVLVVDDSISVRKALEKILTSRDMDIIAADSAESAMSLLEQDSHVDLIISDVVMPGMDGFTLTTTLKEKDAFKSIPILLISGIVDDNSRNKAKQAGAVNIVKKPFTPDEILPPIQTALAQAAKPAPQAAAPAQQPAAQAAPKARPQPGAQGAQGAQGGSQRERLQGQLSELVSKPEIGAAVLFNAQGKYLLAAGDKLPDASKVLKVLLSAAAALGNGITKSPLQSILLEYSQQSVLVYRVNPKLNIALTLSDANALSVAKYMLKKQLPHIKEALRSR
jgi:CheY-like chemotaxis protein/predicted regulator of Ras-like GTPase activity (Roadblock/LC7/MglB family)